MLEVTITMRSGETVQLSKASRSVPDQIEEAISQGHAVKISEGFRVHVLNPRHIESVRAYPSPVPAQ